MNIAKFSLRPEQNFVQIRTKFYSYNKLGWKINFLIVEEKID